MAEEKNIEKEIWHKIDEKQTFKTHIDSLQKKLMGMRTIVIG
jgi:hypothetical protein